MAQPRLIIHGGAGSALKDPSRGDRVREALYAVIDPVYEMLLDGASAFEAVVEGCRRLEEDPTFNAGTGSAIQSDGQVRMSASLMDGATQSFSGVINAMRLAHPVELAEHLQGERDRVLDGAGAQELMRELGVPPHDPIVERRFRQWIRERERGFSKQAVEVVAQEDRTEQDEPDDRGRGTIGVVAFDKDGKLSAGTSTGGRGFERVGRVSDSAMPAGNYADAHCAVSATGIGEHIIDACLSARICVRVADGMSLEEALRKSFDESEAKQYSFGAIAIDHEGRIGWGKTSDILLAAYRVGDEVGDTISLPGGTIVGVLGALQGV
ncbi:isoaspartyl peptidase [Persicimonas caeni]|uniref:Isoaspartyl peptidase n=1 Tax=Persicimonas caeni TaxID=2292766 RepID=A0A4Y6PWI2_PERCE|nr:isoaspartyl peptidase/L-asparaginase [Persicimonas caeni]QDG52688.1 isoaspartyl peptidase [Persicimonas caeni]QED33910.1 isoaspartyl peptidase [Persicimonas caeni]